MTDSPLPFIDTLFQDYVKEAKHLQVDVLYNGVLDDFYAVRQKIYTTYFDYEDKYRSIKNIIDFLAESVNYATENREQVFNIMLGIQGYMNDAKKVANSIPRTYVDLTKKYRDEAIANSNESKSYASLSESWAINHMGSWTRDDSKWWSYVPIDNVRYAKNWADLSTECVQNAKVYKDASEYYMDFVIPEFEFDFDTMTLYQTNYSSIDKNIFTIEDGKLYHEHLSAPYEKVLVQNEKRYRLGIENSSIFYQEF